MAESFVNTCKRDSVSRMNLANARTVMAQMSAAFERVDEMHPHSAPNMKPPREFRQHHFAREHLDQVERALSYEKSVS